MAQMIWNSIVDHIPLWGWMIIFGVPAAAVLYFFYPILLPIWRMLPQPVRAALIAIVVGLLAYLAGRGRGRQNAEDEEKRRNAEALRKRQQVNNEVDNMDKKRVNSELDRWRRD